MWKEREGELLADSVLVKTESESNTKSSKEAEMSCTQNKYIKQALTELPNGITQSFLRIPKKSGKFYN
jgi:hypothetical protein